MPNNFHAFYVLHREPCERRLERGHATRCECEPWHFAVSVQVDARLAASLADCVEIAQRAADAAAAHGLRELEREG